MLPSHQEGKINFMKERDTKMRVSQQIEDPWARYRDSFIDSNQTCEVAGLPRKLKEGDMLITKPRPQTNTDPKCYAVEGNNERGQVNCLLAYDEIFGPVLEIKTIMLGDNLTPTVRVKVPNYQSHTIEGEAKTPISPLRHYSLKGQPEVSNRYRTKEVSWSDVAKLHSKEDRENTWITVITGTHVIFSFHEKVQMAPPPAIKDAGGNLDAQDSAPKNERRNVINHPIKDESRLVWKVLPSHAHFEKNERTYLEYSKSTVILLRHSKMHASNGAVCFQRYANAMYNQMLKAGHKGQYTRENEKEWYWNDYHTLLWYIRRGCNKPRFEILAPANSDAGGDLDALYWLSQSVVAIRAMGGHSNLQVDPEEMGRVRVTHKTCPRLFHATLWINKDSIYDKGLRPGGLDPNGRKEVFFSCKSQAGLDEAESNKQYKAACAEMASNTTGQPICMGYPFKKGDSTLCIDTKKAEECGIVFWQTAALAIVTNKPIPPTCFIHVEDLRTGAIIFTSPKTVQAPTEQEEKVVRPASSRWSKPIQTQEPATTPAGKLAKFPHRADFIVKRGGKPHSHKRNCKR